MTAMIKGIGKDNTWNTSELWKAIQVAYLSSFTYEDRSEFYDRLKESCGALSAQAQLFAPKSSAILIQILLAFAADRFAKMSAECLSGTTEIGDSHASGSPLPED